MKALWDIGWSTVTLDLRGHGEAPPTYIFSSVQAAIDVHHAIAELQRNGMIGEHEELILHGHSLGGFVAQRVVKTWETDTRARPRVVLESPLIDLPLFIVHKAPWLRMMLPLILSRIARLTQIVEPTSPPWSPASFGPPNWGSFQQGKVLYIQASIDQTLGLAQSEAAQRAFPWLNVHRIANLKHSARGANPERDAIIISWINNHSDSEPM